MSILAMPLLNYVTATLFILVCILTMLVVLIQKGRGGGLSGAFGGVGGHSAFGAKTGDVFTWITVGLATCFLLLAVVLNFVFVKLPSSVGNTTPTGTTQSPSGQEGAAPGAQQPPAGPGAPVSRTPAGPAAPAAPSPAKSPAPAPAGPASGTPASEKPAQ
ncbi:MAG: preprotein translocase subunit SecG [Phycisphaerae bacterium]